MFPDTHKTYPGRKFVLGLQVLLMVAIGAFGLIFFLRPSASSPTPRPTATALPIVAAPDNSASTFYERASAAHENKNYAQAISLYTQTLELDPTLADAWLGRGVAREQSNGDERLIQTDLWRYVQLIQAEYVEQDITAADPLTLEMTQGRVYTLSFEAAAGDRFAVTAKSVQKGDAGESDVVDPVIFLFDSAGVLVQANDDTLRDGTLISMDARLDTYEAQRDGIYNIIVSHAGGGSYGLMTVTLTLR